MRYKLLRLGTSLYMAGISGVGRLSSVGFCVALRGIQCILLIVLLRIYIMLQNIEMYFVIEIRQKEIFMLLSLMFSPTQKI